MSDYALNLALRDLLKEFVAIARGNSVITIQRELNGQIESIGVTQNYK